MACDSRKCCISTFLQSPWPDYWLSHFSTCGAFFGGMTKVDMTTSHTSLQVSPVLVQRFNSQNLMRLLPFVLKKTSNNFINKSFGVNLCTARPVHPPTTNLSLTFNPLVIMILTAHVLETLHVFTVGQNPSSFPKQLVILWVLKAILTLIKRDLMHPFLLSDFLNHCFSPTGSILGMFKQEFSAPFVLSHTNLHGKS